MIIRSTSPGIFCAGADLKERRHIAPEDVGPMVARGRKFFREFQEAPWPTIAALDGHALGGGLEWAMSADLRYVLFYLLERIVKNIHVRTASYNAKMGVTETKLAIIPGGGGTQNITRYVGVAKAKELCFTARMIQGEEAERIGLVNKAGELQESVLYLNYPSLFLVPQNSDGDAAFQAALALAREIQPNGPVAVRMAKLALNHGSEVDLSTALAIEQMCYAQVIPTNDRMEGITAFLQKRKPVYTGE